MGFDDLSTDMQEKARAAKTMEDLEELAHESGQELSDEDLDSISGGDYAPSYKSCTSFVTCPTATDMRGSRCTAYLPLVRIDEVLATDMRGSRCTEYRYCNVGCSGRQRARLGQVLVQTRAGAQGSPRETAQGSRCDRFSI